MTIQSKYVHFPVSCTPKICFNLTYLKLLQRSERKITVDDLTSNGYKVEDPTSELSRVSSTDQLHKLPQLLCTIYFLTAFNAFFCSLNVKLKLLLFFILINLTGCSSQQNCLLFCWFFGDCNVNLCSDLESSLQRCSQGITSRIRFIFYRLKLFGLFLRNDVLRFPFFLEFGKNPWGLQLKLHPVENNRYWMRLVIKNLKPKRFEDIFPQVFEFIEAKFWAKFDIRGSIFCKREIRKRKHFHQNFNSNFPILLSFSSQNIDSPVQKRF